MSVDDHRERMRKIAERVAKALGVELGPSQPNPIRVALDPRVKQSDQVAIWPDMPSRDSNDGAADTVFVFLDTVYVEEIPVELQVREVGGQLRVERPSNRGKTWYSERQRRALQRIDAALDGLLSFGIDRGGDEALRAWWRERR